MKLKPKLADIIIIFLAAAVTLFSAYNVYLKPRGEARVLIRGQGSEWIFPLEAQETVVVEGALGETVVQISEKRAFFVSSPCPNKTCVASGFITRHGQWAACLPNNVLLIIQDGEGGNVDAFVR